MKREEFRMAVLHALARLGGRAKREAVMEEIENLLPLSDHDREVLPEADVQRWRKHVDFVVRAFREEDGYLKRPFETEWGVWAFTEAGRERADALMEKLTESGLEDDRS